MVWLSSYMSLSWFSAVTFNSCPIGLVIDKRLAFIWLFSNIWNLLTFRLMCASKKRFQGSFSFSQPTSYLRGYRLSSQLLGMGLFWDSRNRIESQNFTDLCNNLYWQKRNNQRAEGMRHRLLDIDLLIIFISSNQHQVVQEQIVHVLHSVFTAAEYGRLRCNCLFVLRFT